MTVSIIKIGDGLGPFYFFFFNISYIYIYIYIYIGTESEFWLKGGDFIVGCVQWFQPLTLLLLSC